MLRFRTLTIIVMLVVVLSLVGCKSIGEVRFDTSEEDAIAEKQLDAIIEALESQDKEGLKDMFSKTARGEIANLDEQIDDLMEFYKGKKKSYEGNVSGTEHSSYGGKLLEVNGHYTIVTTEERYDIFFTRVDINEDDPEQVGLEHIELVTQEEYEKDDFRWGPEEYGIYTPQR